MSERSIPHIRDIFGSERHETTAGEEETSEKAWRRRCKKKSEEEAKHLERHLSMKKTIRKKMMRDLQQALAAEQEEAKEAVECEQPKQEKEEEKKGFWRRFTMRKNKS
ncbi:uncharacterized protein LOC112127062 [Cimex lectularius]|uniref:Uncharacterized protein n=1 Tax=Cimex lectularius TaxID=79782 RepID=A0A8I6STX1_CIMLE|nr:uncharacterized protein LOC112127062 [Cimex lectularius]